MKYKTYERPGTRVIYHASKEFFVVRNMLIVTDGFASPSEVSMQAPRLHDEWPIDGRAKCFSVDLSNDQFDPGYWNITCRYCTPGWCDEMLNYLTVTYFFDPRPRLHRGPSPLERVHSVYQFMRRCILGPGRTKDEERKG